jgi:hypothetical protein
VKNWEANISIKGIKECKESSDKSDSILDERDALEADM